VLLKRYVSAEVNLVIVHRLLLAALLIAPTLSLAQDVSQAYIGARIIPIGGPEVPDGVLIIQNSKIVAVGSIRSTTIPERAEKHDVKGRVIMPGLVDSHSHIGGVEGADSTAPIQPDIRVLDSINVRSSSIQRAQAGGITTANVMPGVCRSLCTRLWPESEMKLKTSAWKLRQS
jgi:imidazolonepropionase-like amidohydrolase